MMSITNEHIILTHLSRRTDITMARKMVNQILPPELAERVRFLMERPHLEKKNTPVNRKNS